jgi:hypothetical protein
MPSQKEFHDPTEGRGGGSVALFLSVYLVILAFFVLLVSISTFEDVKPEAEVSKPEGEVLPGQKFQELVANIFSTTIQDVSVDIVKPGSLMRVQLVSDILFESGKAEIRVSNHPLLDRIVAALSGRPPGIRFDMEFIIGSSYQEGKTMPVEQTLEMSRAGAFVRAMISRGVPHDSIVVGIQPGDPKKTSMWFYVRSSDVARPKLVQPDKGKAK